MSFQPAVSVVCDDLKTDAVPDIPRSNNDVDEDVESISLNVKETSLNEETMSQPMNLQPPKFFPSFLTKKKSSPKSMPRSPKNEKTKSAQDASSSKKDKKPKVKEQEATTTVIQITNSSQVHFGPNVTINQCSSTHKTQNQNPVPKESKTIRALLESKKQVTREIIMEVAPHVGEHWREFGRNLKFSDARLQQIDQDFYKEGMREVVYQVLKEWMQTNGKEATIGELVRSLKESEEHSAVVKLSKWCKETGML